MGFTSVYRTLQDVFPQVDSRILRAVAIEHSKDADVAVEVVIDEVLPHLREQPTAVSSSNNCMSSPGLFEDGGKTGQLHSNVVINPYLHDQSTETRFSGIDEILPGATEASDAGFSAQHNIYTIAEPVNVEPLAISCYHDAANGENEATYGDKSISINTDCVSPCASGSSDNNDQVSVNVGGENVASFGEFLLLTESGASQSIQEEDNTDVADLTANFEHMHVDLDNKVVIDPDSNPLVVGIREINLAVTQESEPSCSPKTTSETEKDASAIETVNSDYGSVVTSVLARSETNCSTEFLEEIIEEAKNNKKTLVLSMNLVVDLMKEVESKEKAAEQAKEDVTRCCSDILAKVDEVKQALLRAKEANDMHAGEVNAEKAILATELKELQLRLLTLSDERNKSLELLDEMRRGLEIRLATALKEIAEAEEEKIEKERSAREALLYQETQMEKVVQESRRLTLEAEENSKLQDFLMDRGRAIDILQGEISVKCQDVLLLKEKFDKRIPLSRSLSSSQTSSILASSGSSFRSNVTPFEPELEPETFVTSNKSAEELEGDSFDKISRPAVALQSPKSPVETAYTNVDDFPSGVANHIDDRKVLLEDGWDFFDTPEFMPPGFRS